MLQGRIPPPPSPSPFVSQKQKHTPPVDILVELYKEMVKRHWSEEDSAFLDDLKRYLEDQITCSLRVCSRHFALVNKDKLAALSHTTTKKRCPQVMSLPLSITTDHEASGCIPSDHPHFSLLSLSKCLELLWLADRTRPLLHALHPFPNAVKYLSNDKTLKSEHLST